MSADYTITVEPERNLVRIRMGGFFTHDDIAEFVESRRVAHAQLGCARNHHVTLNDLRGMKIQSQDIVEAFRDMLAEPSFRSRRLAFVVSPTLARTQLLRAVAGRDVRFFEDSVQAEAWLLAADDARAA
jgi:hypothetical protein